MGKNIKNKKSISDSSVSHHGKSTANRSVEIDRRKASLIPIAAIGASAGGLEPIEQFFDSMPPDSGCAFVIIQHLSPDFRSLMDELLARHSTMKIFRITDGMKIQPNSIYLNPPRSVMTIEDNRLLVEKITVQETVYLPIDIFFQSLAQERKADAVALVMSGTGTDGTKGSLAIEKVGGQVLVQDPDTTRFDGMPRSALADGLCTLVASPPVLAECVQRILKKESLDGLSSSDRLPISDPLSDVLSMLQHSHGTDFLQYKEATIHRRIQRRAQMRGLTDINEYRDILSTDAEELLELYADLLIEVTEFFRDHQAFEILQNTVIPELTKDLQDGGGLRVWVPGCASGEEAYSIAILLLEQARTMGVFIHLKIMATDIHIRSMNQASSGIYNQAALKNMPEELVERYFDCADGQAQIKPAVRNMVFFSTHDVTRDPPFTRIDLVACRNLLIYLKEEAQEKVMNLLHFSLRKDGYLFLGPSEHIGAIAHEFEVVNEKWRMYKKRRDVKLLVGESIFHRTDIGTNVARSSAIQQLATKNPVTAVDDTIPFRRAHRAALEAIVARYAPPGFLLTDQGVVVHIFGNAGELIPLQSGSFSKRIIDLIRPELKVVVTAALDHSKYTDFKIFSRAAYVQNETDSTTNYEVTLVPMELPGEAQKFLLLSVEQSNVVQDSNEEVTQVISKKQLEVYDASEEMQARISFLEHSLLSSEENLQSTIEELETSNEELQSTNEELMSTNEELQSTNEELHSVNEELYTVSAEHQRKNEELTDRETDISVLLQSSKIGTLHLDSELRLLRYSNNARSVFNILPQDVGRPIAHITVRSDNHTIYELIDRANMHEETHETQLQVEQSVFLIRILPYIKEERPAVDDEVNIASSVLITVIDITDVETVRAQLAELNSQYRYIIEHTDSFVVNWDARSDEITYCNESYAKRKKSTPKELIGKNIVALRAEKEQPIFRASIAEIAPNQNRTEVITRADDHGRLRYANMSTKAVSKDGETIDEYHAIGFDCTDEYSYRHALEQLFTVFADESLQYDEKLEHLLGVGLAYYELDTAMVSMVIGDVYELVCVKSNIANPKKVGVKLKASDTMCSILSDTTTSVSIDNVSKSEYKRMACHRNTGIECFVGATVNTANGPYGTVSFSSTNSREQPFTIQEESFALLMGNWIGFLLGNQEQLDFISDQNHYYKSLFQTVPAMLFLCDADGLIISASDRLCSKLGLNSETVPGNNCFELFNTSDDAALSQAIAQGDAHRLALSVNVKGGETFDVEINSSIKAVGSLKGTRMVVLTDVSERNKATRMIEEQNRSLESANENLNQFAFIASHDLQEPLRKIQQFSSLLNEEIKSDLTQEGAYHLNVIVDASERMSTLIYDLLRYSGASQEHPKKETISLVELLNEVVKELDIPIEESNAVINIGQLPDMTGDRALLRQLFTNLISNSIKYRSKDRPLVISVDSFGADLQGGLTVADNGIGFEMEYAKKIFEPFNRLHKSKDYKGNGIGLAICNTVCDKHNWTLNADSELDVGSTFTIHFNKDEPDARNKGKDTRITDGG